MFGSYPDFGTELGVHTKLTNRSSNLGNARFGRALQEEGAEEVDLVERNCTKIGGGPLAYLLAGGPKRAVRKYTPIEQRLGPRGDFSPPRLGAERREADRHLRRENAERGGSEARE